MRAVVGWEVGCGVFFLYGLDLAVSPAFKLSNSFIAFVSAGVGLPASRQTGLLQGLRGFDASISPRASIPARRRFSLLSLTEGGINQCE